MTGGELFPIVTEVAKPVQNAVGQTLSEGWQGLVGDRVTAWRIKNAAKVNEKLGKELAKSGLALNLDKIPEGVAFAWFEKATQSDDPEIQELFAKLLANAASGNAEALKKRNIDLIAGLTPEDARLLAVVAEGYNEYRSSGIGDYRPYQISLNAWLPQTLKNDHGIEDMKSFDALYSSGILRYDKQTTVDTRFVIRTIANNGTRPFGPKGYHASDFDKLLQVSEVAILTAVGASLLQALFPGSENR